MVLLLAHVITLPWLSFLEQMECPQNGVRVHGQLFCYGCTY